MLKIMIENPEGVRDACHVCEFKHEPVLGNDFFPRSETAGTQIMLLSESKPFFVTNFSPD
jgi:hypothetical protein